MCGFVGFTGLREQREAILHRMADRIIHRGPDMEGYHISGDDPRTAIALGFRNEQLMALLIMLGSPSTPSGYIMAKQMGADAELSSGVVVLTTLLASVTITGWIFLLRSLSLL